MMMAVLALLVGGCTAGGSGSGVEVATVTAIPVESPTNAAAIETVEAVLVPPELLVSTEEVAQGSAILVSVTGSVTEGEVVFLGQGYPLTQGDFSKYTYVGIGVLDAPGNHTMYVNFTLTNGSSGNFEREIMVSETEWDISHIYYVAGAGDPVLDQSERAREDALLAETYARVTPNKLWEGRWQKPTEGLISSHFGERRSFNDGPVEGNHGGTDFGALEGTPVTATNSGRVVLARQLAVRGNMVIIDHGGGVFSGYAHLSAFAVAEGQEVDGGQLIAFVGSSGLSTAPHLHWEISVHGVLVDPLRFVDFRNGF
tara:strand:+ start:2186 stop:3124 length:939 start_codon:yes stop_codon:yes gene_type:complete